MTAYQTPLWVLSLVGVLSLAHQDSAKLREPAQAPAVSAPDDTAARLRRASIDSAETVQLAIQDRRALLEYQIAEKVEAEVLDSLKGYAAILGVALAFVGFMGSATVIDMITRRVEKDISARVDRETEALRSRSQEALADLNLSLKEQRTLLATAVQDAEALRAKHAELRDVGQRYESLHDEIVAIRLRVESAARSVAETQRATEVLRNEVVDTVAGKPTVITSGFTWDNGYRGAIKGANFGSARGRLVVRFTSEILSRGDNGEPIADRRTSERLVIPHDHISVWTPTEINFILPAEGIVALKWLRDDVEREFAQLPPAKRIERSNGFVFSVDAATEVSD